ncbi:MAG: YtxH domain-containing protein [candidate division NC10 bacterium]|nr:YtxH domain-containing protein [candidate division NC10 bacterium]
MSSERGISGSAVVLAFLLGGALGAGLALLYAPESGKRTRVRLRQFAEEAQEKTEETVKEFRDKAEGRVREWRDRVEEVVSTGKELLEEKKDLLTGAYEAGKEAFLRERRKLSGGDAEPASPR